MRFYIKKRIISFQSKLKSENGEYDDFKLLKTFAPFIVCLLMWFGALCYILAGRYSLAFMNVCAGLALFFSLRFFYSSIQRDEDGLIDT